MASRKRYHAELWDKMQFCYGDYNDHQVRAVVYFDGLLDRDYIKRAVILSVYTVPILGCRFVSGMVRPYWEETASVAESDFFSYRESEDLEAEAEKFITGRTNELKGPQIKALLIRSSGKDTLCIVINHMICDGTGIKEYLYLLSSIYTNLMDGIPEPDPCITGSRSSGRIYKGFGMLERLKVMMLPVQHVKNINLHRFPIETGLRDRTPFIMKFKIAPDDFIKLKEYGKKYSATINDIAVTACYRAVIKMLGLKQAENMTIPSMVDLRRYISDKKNVGICNHSSMIICKVTVDPAESFESTLRKVSAEMLGRKGDYPGLYGLSTLNAAFKLMPFAFVRKSFKKYFINPNICVTNIGIIDSAKLIFRNTPVINAFVSPSIKYPPYFQLAFSNFEGAMTFCVNLYGTEKDRKSVGEFFGLLEGEFKTVCGRY